MLLVNIFEMFGAFILWSLTGFKGDLTKIVDKNRILCQLISGVTLALIVFLVSLKR